MTPGGSSKPWRATRTIVEAVAVSSTGTASSRAVGFTPSGSGTSTRAVLSALWTTIGSTPSRSAQTGTGLSLGATMVTSGSGTSTRAIWEATLKGHLPVVAVAVTPDGHRIVSGGWDNTVRIWNIDSGRFECSLQGHTGNVRAVALSRDGHRIVSGGNDQTVSGYGISTWPWNWHDGPRTPASRSVPAVSPQLTLSCSCMAMARAVFTSCGRRGSTSART